MSKTYRSIPEPKFVRKASETVSIINTVGGIWIQILY